MNATVSVCATRDTEVVAAVTEATEEADNVEGEPRHLDGEMYQPKEDAKWEFKSGTCVFRLRWVLFPHNLLTEQTPMI